MINIHTRDRFEVVRKSLPRWIEVTRRSIPINLIVEPGEWGDHKTLLREMGLEDRVDVIKLPRPNMGMGWSRHIGYRAAVKYGAQSFITTDDDLYPRNGPEGLLRLARKDSVLGISGYFSIYGLHKGLEEGDGVHPTSGIFRCWAQNTRNTTKVGGFPKRFKGYDDHEIGRWAIARLHLPWYVDCDTVLQSIGKIGEKGGMCALPGYEEVYDRRHRAHKLSHDAWPDYVSSPERCEPPKCKYVMQWKKMMKDYGVIE